MAREGTVTMGEAGRDFPEEGRDLANQLRQLSRKPERQAWMAPHGVGGGRDEGRGEDPDPGIRQADERATF